MRRSPVPLLRAEAVLTRPAPALVPAPARAEAHKAVVRRFYAGVNAALETGDVAPLMAVVAPDFVAHAPRPWWPPGRASLARELRALRAAAPGLRLTPTTLLADGDQVVAQVAEAHPPVSFLGLPLPARAALWGAIDRFRAIGPELLAVEAGTLEVTTGEGRAWGRLDPAGSRTLEPRTALASGQRIFVEPGAAAAYRNAGDAPLVLLIATLTPAGPPTGSPPAATPPPPGHASPAPTEALPAHW